GHILELRDGLLDLLGGAETHPGALHPPSGIYRQLPTVLGPQQLPPHLLPLPAPALTTVPTPQPSPPYGSHPSQVSHVSHASQLSHSQPASAPYGYASIAPPRSKAPMWLGLGAIAISIGVGGAMIVMHNNGTSDEPTSPVTAAVVVAPTVEPVPPPPPPPRPRQIELRFDSLPSAGVYAEGHSAELCRTPCAFNVDLSDGEATDHRNFVVRSEGFLDKTLAIDLAGAQREFHVTLERDQAQVDPTEKKRPGKYGKRPGKPDKSDKPDKPVAVEETKPAVVETPKRDDALEKIDRTKPTPTIDPTDTHDPFKKHK
ncbi:MAG: hypothetical protein ABI678_19840, partial [Kofleriaceae bacterium]